MAHPDTENIPRPGRTLPDAALTGGDGEVVSLSRYRHARNLILIFLGSASDLRMNSLILGLKKQYGAIRDAGSEVLVVLPDSAGQAREMSAALAAPFPILADADGQAHDRFGASDGPAAYVADRFGEIHFAARSAEGGALPSALDLLGWLNHIEMLCPE